MKPTIIADVTFLSKADGGRNSAAHNSTQYRPHLVVGDQNQRKPIYAEDGHTGIEEYLGIGFTGDGEIFAPGQKYKVTLGLIYFPEVNYGKLVAGAEFTIREGGKIVGYGMVRRGLSYRQIK
jgi:hypothetical protein